MKMPKKCVSIKNRAAVKMASRGADRRRLAQGLKPEELQRENSIFPPSYFDQHRILNFSSAIGK
jgi:hypothetical protein